MKKELFFTVMICSAILSSCIKFLYPLTENKGQMVFKSELLGRWKEDDGTEYLIDSIDQQHYRVVEIDTKKESGNYSDSNYFLMILVNVNGNYFLDCTPDITRPAFYQLGEQASGYFLPVHYVLKLNAISQTSIGIATINTGQVRKLVDEQKFAVHYDSTENNDAFLLLKPQEIQQKLIELQKFPSAWDKETLKRF